MVTFPKGPAAWKIEQTPALQQAGIDAWGYPLDGWGVEVALRDEFLAWAKTRPRHLRQIRDGTSLFRIFIDEIGKTPQGALKILEIKKREYKLAYQSDAKFPGWSKEKSLQMIRRIDSQIQKIKEHLAQSAAK
ncbi:MAG: hypothetical protein ACRDFW_08995 [bacterium]